MTIQKNAVLPPEQDYTLLRNEGLQYIESLASDLWTDYNEHDPGITILELLCYALTELGYRTGFDIKDILADNKGKLGKDQCFYTAREILTTHPWTINDYRKLLIDQKNIQNAWLYHTHDTVGQEVSFYADCKHDKLSLDYPRPVPDDHLIKLSGLYRVLLDLESDPELGDLNNTHVKWRIPGSDIEDKVFTFVFSDLETLPYDDYKAVVGTLCDDHPATHIAAVNIQRKQYYWEVIMDVDYVINGDDYTASFTLVVRMDSLQKRDAVNDMLADLQSWFSQDDFIRNIFSLYKKKTKLVRNILTTTKALLWDHRNLCEDFLQVQTVTDVEIAMCMDIDVTPEADIEEILATVFYKVQEYFAPSLKFYSLKTLLEAGKPVDLIFESPVLSHGFIDNDELEKTQLRRIIRTSDLVNIIMGIEGVLAVKDLVLTRYSEKGEPVLPSEAWCLDIGAMKKPLLNTDRSKIIFYKGRIPLKAKIAETLDTLKYLQAVNSHDKLYGTQDDLLLSDASYHDLADYYSIQNDLPQTYGVGRYGLADSVGPQRMAQSRQLKAYLMFYDQLLADFFAQLNGVKKLFSLDDTLAQSYFTQYLAEATPPDYEEGVKGAADIYQNPSYLEQLLQAQAVNSTDWQWLIEDKQTFFDRRNMFLDHLLARFAESFNDYALMMYQIHFDLQQSDAYSKDKVIKDKIKFLKDYPGLSRNRGKAFNYCPLKTDVITGNLVINMVTDVPEVNQAALWGGDNISGLERRASLLSGIPSWPDNRISAFLFCIRMADVIKKEITVKDDHGNNVNKTVFSFAFYNDQDKVILRSVKEDYASRISASDAAVYTAGFLADKKYYYAQKQADNTWRLFTSDDENNNTNLLATDGIVYASLHDANQAKEQYRQLFDTDCDKEGLYLVEHILLRPRAVPSPEAAFDLMEVCLGKDCHFCGEQDPYSFRASVVLPYWPRRFRNTYFRRYFEDILQEEAPAHIALKICWVNNASMREFETAFRLWVNTLAAYKANETDKTLLLQYRDANDKLIQILQNLHSEYPLATLHDCEESANDNLVILGNTVLGSYKT